MKIMISFFKIMNQSWPQTLKSKKLNQESSNEDFLIIFDFLKDFDQENKIFFYHTNDRIPKIINQSW